MADTSAALDFLRAFRPTGFWILTAILPDRTGDADRDATVTRSFAVTEDLATAEWIERWNAGWTDEAGRVWEPRNIYFSVNPALRPVAKKASREEIASLEYLHVDLDPRKGFDLAEEHARCVRALTTELPQGVPPPTFVVDSGGGAWGFWKLETPLPIEGKQAAYEEATRYNLQLEVLFGADHCHNVDRIARLPGTANYPSESKRKQGRTETRASLLAHVTACVYPIARFTPAPLVQDAGFGTTNHVQVSGNVQRLSSVDELPDKVGRLCRIVIVQGKDPDNPEKWVSRSEPLLWVCCEMLRAGCSDDLIYSVITDPSFGISESVLEKGTRAEKYAIRQIEQAHEYVVDPMLRFLNEKHAVIGDVNGKCRIVSEYADPALKRPGISFQTFEDFCNRYLNTTVETLGGKDGASPVQVPLGKWWVRHPMRRSYEGLTFAPGLEDPHYYNLWRGFACDAKPGSCELFLKHLRENICRGDETAFRYLMGWMACAVQRPGEQGHVAVVMRGKKGTGKGMFATLFGNLFGRHFVHVTNTEHLAGKFNAHMRDCVVLFADEAFFAGDKRHESTIKTMVTEDMLIREHKGVDAGPAKNFLHVIIASNEEWVIPAGSDERRYFMLDVGDASMQDLSYFSAIKHEYKNGGQEALLHLLMHYDVSEYEARAVPKTAALQDQKMHSLTAEQEWWYSKLQAGEVYEGEGWPSDVYCSHLAHDFVLYVKTWDAYSRKGNSTKLGRFMAKVLGDDCRKQKAGEHHVVGIDGKMAPVTRPRVYVLPSLEECRAKFVTEFIGSGTFAWPEAPATVGQLDLVKEAY